jgi:probable phosphoglycerate mutase
MRINFYLVRHGNTFNSADTPYWIGEKEDLPLTLRGQEQALEVSHFLQKLGVQPAIILSGSLQRTRHFAQIIKRELKTDALLGEDFRLNEIDYGHWAGNTDEQIAQKYGQRALNNWRDKGHWPKEGQWGKGEEEIKREVRDFSLNVAAKFSKDADVIVVSSNGRLRYFLNLIEGEFERRASQGQLKMRTGYLSLLTYNEGAFSLNFWNKSPLQD